MNDDTHQELFQRAIAVAQLAAADRPETGIERHVYMSGLIAGLCVSLGETMTDAELHAALDECAAFATAWRAHNTARAN